MFYHEFSERKLWDEDLDPEAASDARVWARELGEGEGDDQDEGRIVWRWIEEVTGGR